MQKLQGIAVPSQKFVRCDIRQMGVLAFLSYSVAQGVSEATNGPTTRINSGHSRSHGSGCGEIVPWHGLVGRSPERLDAMRTSMTTRYNFGSTEIGKPSR